MMHEQIEMDLFEDEVAERSGLSLISSMTTTDAGNSTIVTRNVVMPSLFKDLCRVRSIYATGLKIDQLPKSLDKLKNAINNSVPLNGNTFTSDNYHQATAGALSQGYLRITDNLQRIVSLMKSQYSWALELGTIGNGYIDLSSNDTGDLYITIEQDSLSIGNAVLEYYINIANDFCEDYDFVHNEKAFIPSVHVSFDDFLFAMLWLDRYVLYSKRIVLANSLQAIKSLVGGDTFLRKHVETTTNYFERVNDTGDVIHRCGTVSNSGEMILGNETLYIVESNGNSETVLDFSSDTAPENALVLKRLLRISSRTS